MKKIIVIIGTFLLGIVSLKAQTDDIPDFLWGNTAYFNLNVGESIYYFQKEIRLLSINNQCNKIKVDGDTLNIRISQRTLPESAGGLRIFVADNKDIRLLSDNKSAHGLLKKDALVAVSSISKSLLNKNDYVFPVSFNDGFIWNPGEDNQVFSLVQSDNSGKKFTESEGINFDLKNDHELQNHWMVAIENSKVAWIYENEADHKSVAVLLESESNSGIYYYYGNLYKRNLEVHEGQDLLQGELIGTIPDEAGWGSVRFTIVKHDTIPEMKDVYTNVINFFPQLFELYFNKSYSFSRLYSKGKINFGNKRNNNDINNQAFEDFAGKGWIIGCWNKSGQISFVFRGDQHNVRLNKLLFANTSIESVNPYNYYDYEISVKNGLYRIRAKMGDVEMATWQRVEFENVSAGDFSLGKGVQDWTTERIVKVDDGKLTVRIYIDPKKPAGISEIVFQQAL